MKLSLFFLVVLVFLCSLLVFVKTSTTLILEPRSWQFSMAKNNKKHDFRDLKNLIKELDERQDKAIDEIRKHNAKAMALKLLIAGMTIQG